MSLAWIDAHWESAIRPALREHVARIERETGRRPAAGEMLAIVGATEDVAHVTPIPLEGPGIRIVCMVVARETGPAVVLVEAIATPLVEQLARLPATGLCILEVGPGWVGLQHLPNIVDTGPEGDRINSPGGRSPS